MTYAGPLRDEPIAIELHNTIYATSAGPVDGLADPASARAWLEALAPRLFDGPRRPAARTAGRGLPAGPWPSHDELVALRDAVRRALHAAVEGAPLPSDAIDAINAASRRAPRAPVAVQAGAGCALATDFGDAARADIVLAAFAADTIELLTGEHRDDLRTCAAPRCVLMFLKDHPRRAWCSDRCGNRARQARHYERRTRRH